VTPSRIVENFDVFDFQIKQSISEVGSGRVTTEPVAMIQAVNSGDLLVRQLEIKDVEVLDFSPENGLKNQFPFRGVVFRLF
jgi:hypothetical protein